VTVKTFSETASILSEYRDVCHKASFSVFGGGCAERFYSILRNRFGLKILKITVRVQKDYDTKTSP